MDTKMIVKIKREYYFQFNTTDYQVTTETRECKLPVVQMTFKCHSRSLVRVLFNKRQDSTSFIHCKQLHNFPDITILASVMN